MLQLQRHNGTYTECPAYKDYLNKQGKKYQKTTPTKNYAQSTKQNLNKQVENETQKQPKQTGKPMESASIFQELIKVSKDLNIPQIIKELNDLKARNASKLEIIKYFLDNE